jgi:PAS domain S-box-containing protein
MGQKKADHNGSGDPSPGSGEDLRRKAEERLRKQSPDPGAANPEEDARLLYELQVHQIELEMQNEELRRAQQELEASRTRYFKLYDLAPVGYLTLGDHGLILEGNLTAAQMLGVERSRLTGQPLTRFIAPDDQDIYYLHRKKLSETGTRQVCEVRMAHGDGGQFWARLETTVVQDGEDGGAVCCTVMSDITEREQMEEKLRESETLFRNLFEHHAAAKLIIDPNTGNILDANVSAEEFYGWTREQLRKMKIQDINTLSPEKVRQEMEKARAHERIHFEFRHRRANGSILDVEVFSSKIEVKGKVFLHSIIHDVTDRKQAEKALEEEHRRLQKTLEDVRTLRGIVPICSSCKKIRDDKGYWNQVEKYVSEHSEAEFSHGICPECLKKLYPEFAQDESRAKP